jgi:5-methylcytosine-specific restriction enzyme A
MEKALRFCSWPGCNQLGKGQYCEEHQAQHEMLRQENNRQYNRQRGSAASQGYDNQWNKVRLAYLRKNPLCEECQKNGLVVPAVLVHHRKELKDGGDRLNPENLESVCNACHERIHGPQRWVRR